MIALIWKDGRVEHVRQSVDLRYGTLLVALLEQTVWYDMPISEMASYGELVKAGDRTAFFTRIGQTDSFRQA